MYFEIEKLNEDNFLSKGVISLYFFLSRVNVLVSSVFILAEILKINEELFFSYRFSVIA